MGTPNYLLPYGLALTLSPPLTPPDRRDLLDYAGSNSVQTARYIDPVTRDFVVSANNHFQGMNNVEQEVLLAVSTTFNSSVLLNFGQNFASMQVITKNVQTQMVGLLNQCLAYQIQNNLITIQNASVATNSFGQVSLQFVFTNNTTGVQTEVQYLIPGT